MELDGQVAVLHITAGQNRHNLDWLAEFDAALDRVEAAEAVLITTGHGKFFSNGLDLDWLMSGADTTGFFETLHARDRHRSTAHRRDEGHHAGHRPGPRPCGR